ncbi:MAG: hypothetical protein LiPW30_230 [Parcubacteria group bacterium LiPW_30]|nr:MAG: hypothetical protein LiPW30_230 [Parcubacteria group bacterium LiPW_30]
MEPINDINSVNQVSSTPTPSPVEEKGGVGGVIAIIIIVLVLAVGGYYVWQSSDVVPTTQENTAQVPVTNDLAQIEADLGAVDSSTATDADVKNIESELLQ